MEGGSDASTLMHTGQRASGSLHSDRRLHTARVSPAGAFTQSRVQSKSPPERLPQRYPARRSVAGTGFGGGAVTDDPLLSDVARLTEMGRRPVMPLLLRTVCRECLQVVDNLDSVAVPVLHAVSDLYAFAEAPASDWLVQ